MAALRRRAAELGDALREEAGGEAQPDVIGQAIAELGELLDTAADPRTIRLVVDALSHAWDERAALLVLPLAQRGHPDAVVREAVAHVLPLGVESDEVRTSAVAALLPMTGDPAPGVRDYACFALGQLEADGPDVRDALAARLDDAHDDARCEALVALARLGDHRTLQPVIDALSCWPDDLIFRLELEAAAELADPELLPHLRALVDEWQGDDDRHTQMLEVAIRRCEPATALSAAAFERRLEEAVNERLVATAVAFRLDGSYPRTVATVRRRESGEVAYASRLWDLDTGPDADFEQQVGSWEMTALSDHSD